MTADGQQKHTFDPLPEEAKIISEKDGVCTVELENGVTLSLSSKEKQERVRKQPTRTLEQRRNAQPIEVIVPDEPNSAPEVDLHSPKLSSQFGEAPATLPKKNFKTSSAYSLSALEVLCFCILLESLKKS